MPDINKFTCIKCGSEGPHHMRYCNNMNIVNVRQGRKNCPEIEQWIQVTCVGCSYAVKKPCEDANEEEGAEQ